MHWNSSTSALARCSKIMSRFDYHVPFYVFISISSSFALLSYSRRCLSGNLPSVEVYLTTTNPGSCCNIICGGIYWIKCLGRVCELEQSSKLFYYLVTLTNFKSQKLWQFMMLHQLSQWFAKRSHEQPRPILSWNELKIEMHNISNSQTSF